VLAHRALGIRHAPRSIARSRSRCWSTTTTSTTAGSTNPRKGGSSTSASHSVSAAASRLPAIGGRVVMTGEPQTLGSSRVAAGGGALVSVDLPDCAQAPAAGRRALVALNGSWHLISAARLRDVELLVSELVANAVRHGARSGAPVKVIVRTSAQTMRVEVSDAGAGFDPTRLAAPSSERGGGWGLAIVAALAHRWGVEREHGTTRCGLRSIGPSARRRSSRTAHRRCSAWRVN
jgi:anti-sigma regulatory factor (Ser/Thr protein kinase)